MSRHSTVEDTTVMIKLIDKCRNKDEQRVALASADTAFCEVKVD